MNTCDSTSPNAIDVFISISCGYMRLVVPGPMSLQAMGLHLKETECIQPVPVQPISHGSTE